jgi:hypothetical protein
MYMVLAIVGAFALSVYLLSTNQPGQPPPEQPGNFGGALFIIIVIGIIGVFVLR